MQNHYIFKSDGYIFIVPYGIAEITFQEFKKTKSLETQNFSRMHSIQFLPIYEKLTQEQKDSIYRVEDFTTGVHPLHKFNF